MDELGDQRLSLSLLTSMDFLISSGFIDCIPDYEPEYMRNVMRSTWTSISKTSDTAKKIAGASLYCSILRCECYCKTSFNYLIVLLCSASFPRVRVAVAEKLHTSILTFSENCFPESSDSEARMERCLELLSETDWSIPVENLKPIRNQVATLLEVKCPS